MAPHDGGDREEERDPEPGLEHPDAVAGVPLVDRVLLAAGRRAVARAPSELRTPVGVRGMAAFPRRELGVFRVAGLRGCAAARGAAFGGRSVVVRVLAGVLVHVRRQGRDGTAAAPLRVAARLLLPGPHQDHPTVTFLQRRLYPRLERAGMSVYEYQPSMMHSKTMAVDDRLVVVGSINLDFLSMEWLEEGCLVVDDRPFAAELERRWGDDLSRSREVAGPRPSRARLENTPALERSTAT